MEVLKRADAGVKVPDLCREIGVYSATFYKWCAKFGGMDVTMMSRMEALEGENWRLKKMYLQEMLKAEIVAEAFEKSDKAISQTWDDQISGGATRDHGQACMRGLPDQPRLLPLGR